MASILAYFIKPKVGLKGKENEMDFLFPTIHQILHISLIYKSLTVWVQPAASNHS